MQIAASDGEGEGGSVAVGDVVGTERVERGEEKERENGRRKATEEQTGDALIKKRGHCSGHC